MWTTTLVRDVHRSYDKLFSKIHCFVNLKFWRTILVRLSTFSFYRVTYCWSNLNSLFIIMKTTLDTKPTQPFLLLLSSENTLILSDSETHMFGFTSCSPKIDLILQQKISRFCARKTPEIKNKLIKLTSNFRAFLDGALKSFIKCPSNTVLISFCRKNSLCVRRFFYQKTSRLDYWHPL